MVPVSVFYFNSVGTRQTAHPITEGDMEAAPHERVSRTGMTATTTSTIQRELKGILDPIHLVNAGTRPNENNMASQLVEFQPGPFLPQNRHEICM